MIGGGGYDDVPKDLLPLIAGDRDIVEGLDGQPGRVCFMTEVRLWFFNSLRTELREDVGQGSKEQHLHRTPSGGHETFLSALRRQRWPGGG